MNALLVLNTLKDIPKSTVDQIAAAINISAMAVKGILDTSIEAGLVEVFGNGKNRTYILSTKVYATRGEKIGYVRQVDIDEAVRTIEEGVSRAGKPEPALELDLSDFDLSPAPKKKNLSSTQSFNL